MLDTALLFLIFLVLFDEWSEKRQFKIRFIGFLKKVKTRWQSLISTFTGGS